MEASLQVNYIYGIGFSVILDEQENVSKYRGIQHIGPLKFPMTHQIFDIESYLHYDLDQHVQEFWTYIQGNWIFAVYKRDIHKKYHTLQYLV